MRLLIFIPELKSSGIHINTLPFKGGNVQRDYGEAIKWNRLAAAQGQADAQSNMGKIYSDGLGIRQDKKTAKKWYGKACDKGNQRGCDNYRTLNKAGY